MCTRLVVFLLLTEYSCLSHFFLIAIFYLYVTLYITKPEFYLFILSFFFALEIIVINDLLTSLEAYFFTILIAPYPINHLTYLEKFSQMTKLCFTAMVFRSCRNLWLARHSNLNKLGDSPKQKIPMVLNNAVTLVPTLALLKYTKGNLRKITKLFMDLFFKVQANYPEPAGHRKVHQKVN